MIDWIKNIFKGLFIHPKCDQEDNHVRYSGMSVNGHKCNKCGYEWYEDK